MSLGKLKKNKSLYRIFSTLSGLDILLSVLIAFWLLYTLKDFNSLFDFAAIIIITFNLIVVTLLCIMLHKKLLIPINQIQDKISEIEPNQIKSGNMNDISELESIFYKLQFIDDMSKQRTINYSESELKKKKLLSCIAHDLRMPLTSIIGYAEAIKDGIYTKDKLDKNIETILNSANHLNKLIDDLEIYSKTDLNELKIYKRNVLSNEILEKYFSNILIPEHINLKLNQPFTNTLLNIDPVRFKQILDNLMSNAIKHAKTTINISTQIKRSKIAISISNDGDIIDDNLKAKIFDPFFIINKKRDGEEKGGTGLGLTIVKQLVEIQNGNISINTDSNGLTEFTIEFPIIRT